MSIPLQEDVFLKDHCTFRLGGWARFFAKAESLEDLIELSRIAKEKGVPFMPLGKGSNCIFTDDAINVLVAQVNIKGREIVGDSGLLKLGAGEVWDEVVAWTVEHGLSGIEAMSAIPGTVGATPVQNVGAYGQEIKDTLIEVGAYDTQTGEKVTLSNAECKFGYRTSIFNTTEKGRYLIGSVTLKLSKNAPTVPDYPGVREYFHVNKDGNGDGENLHQQKTLKEIREAIISIRANKLPDPSRIANVGSFFKNALIEKTLADELKEKYPDMPMFEQPDGKIKVPSGWLIEKAGFKGKNFGTISVYEKNALVLVNNGTASFDELIEAKKQIFQKVKELFGIELEQEPLLIK